MANLTPEFAGAMRRDPRRPHRVLIVFASGEAAAGFSPPGARRFMDTIVAAQLTGEEILQLAGNNGIISIEPDGEMNAL